MRRRRPASDDAGAVPSRSRWLWIWATASAASIALAFGIGTQVRSPWESAIANSDSNPQVTATVEVRTLSRSVDPISGTVSLGAETTVGGASADGSQPVVTAVHVAVGDQIHAGQVVAEVAGRPIVALTLPFSLYRDLVPGDEGPDVEALQQAMTELGTYRGVIDGDYGQATARAVDATYAAAEAMAPSPDPAIEAAAKDADSALADAQAALADAQAQAGLDGSSTSITEETKAVADARTAAEAARLAAMTPLPRGETLAIGASGVTVVAVSPVGTILGEAGGALTVRSGAPSVVVRVGVDEIDGFAAGTTVDVTGVADATRSDQGTVTSVGEFQAVAGDGGVPGYDVTVQLGGDVFGDQEAVLLVGATAEPAVEGLTVPVVALRDDAEGKFVLRATTDGQPAQEVRVTVLSAVDGYALVADGDLREGDTVIVVPGS